MFFLLSAMPLSCQVAWEGNWKTESGNESGIDNGNKTWKGSISTHGRIEKNKLDPRILGSSIVFIH